MGRKKNNFKKNLSIKTFASGPFASSRHCTKNHGNSYRQNDHIDVFQDTDQKEKKKKRKRKKKIKKKERKIKKKKKRKKKKITKKIKNYYYYNYY